MASTEDIEAESKPKPLQLTLSVNETTSKIWSPFNRVESVDIPHIKGKTPDVAGIHRSLLKIKNQFPREEKIVLVPAGTVSYDALVSIMDTVRLLEKSDPPLFAKNPKTGIDEQVTRLFPQIIFGNLLGES